MRRRRFVIPPRGIQIPIPTMRFNTPILRRQGGFIRVIHAQQPTSWPYPGVPSPTDLLPNTVAPTVPFGRAGAGFPWDPLDTTDVPTYTGGSGDWYVKDTGNDATAGNSGRGTPANPRRNIPPDGTNLPRALQAGDRVFIENSAGGVFGSGGTLGWTTLQGGPDAADRIYILKATETMPVLNYHGISLDGPTHLIMHGLDHDMSASTNPSGMSILAGSCVVFRNGRQRHNGTAVGNNVAFNMNGTGPANRCERIVYYNNIAEDLGDYHAVAGENDYHVFRPFQYTMNCFMIGNTVRRIGGDACQVANSLSAWGGNAPAGLLDVWEARPHYTWLIGNDISFCGENAFDYKNSWFVLSAWNHLYNISEGTGGPATAIICSNNNEGPLTRYHYSLWDHVHDCTFGIRLGGDQNGEIMAAYSGLVYNITNGCVNTERGNAAAHTTGRAVHMTAADSGIGYGFQRNGGGNWDYLIRCCLSYNHSFAHVANYGGTGTSVGPWSSAHAELINHLAFQPGGSANGVSSTDWDVWLNNFIDQDPDFVNPAAANYNLGPASAADGLVVADDLIAEGLSFLDLDWAYDLNGNPRPPTGAAVGCYEPL